MKHDHRHVAVVGVRGAERRLAEAGISDVTISDDDLSTAAFDESAHNWTLPTCRAQVLVTDQIRCGPEGLAPYLGVAVHGVPNYFTITGTGPVAAARLAYVAECLELMRRTGSTRIEVLFSAQRMCALRGPGEADRADASFWRRMTREALTAFDLTSHQSAADEVYDGTAVVSIGDDDRRVRVRLTGRLDPIDGRYHWQGTIFEAALGEVLKQPRTVSMRIGERSADCRITERTSQGGYSVAGVGAPPYALGDVEVVVPSR